MSVRSLRVRMLVAMAIVLLALVSIIGGLSSITAKSEFDRFLLNQDKLHDLDAAAILRAHVKANGWTNIEPALRNIHHDLFLRSIIVRPDGKIVRYPADLDGYAIRVLEEGLLLSGRRNGATERILMRIPPHDVEGARAYFMPLANRLPALRRSFGGRFDRWLMIVIAASLLAALALTFTMLRRIFAPVEELTRGVRSLAGGRLDARVKSSGDDEIGELARAFNAMAAALERNERARRNMVTDVAHELRTPLTNIRVQIEAAQDGVIEADRAFLDSLEEDAGALSHLVDDLQQLSLAEAGQLRLEREQIDVREVVLRSLDGLQRRIDERGLALRVEVPEGLEVNADGRRIVQVIRNLVVNALTHARGSIAIAAAPVDGCVVVRVEDDGLGVPPEHADRIFDRFHRADPSRSRTTGGAGLGLAIARELVELHGGTLHLENEPGEGAAFVFTL